VEQEKGQRVREEDALIAVRNLELFLRNHVFDEARSHSTKTESRKENVSVPASKPKTRREEIPRALSDRSICILLRLMEHLPSNRFGFSVRCILLLRVLQSRVSKDGISNERCCSNVEEGEDAHSVDMPVVLRAVRARRSGVSSRSGQESRWKGRSGCPLQGRTWPDATPPCTLGTGGSETPSSRSMPSPHPTSVPSLRPHRKTPPPPHRLQDELELSLFLSGRRRRQ
jgi:hypothetical protein